VVFITDIFCNLLIFLQCSVKCVLAKCIILTRVFTSYCTIIMRSNSEVLGLILSEQACVNKKKIVLFSFKVVSVDCNVIFLCF